MCLPSLATPKQFGQGIAACAAWLDQRRNALLQVNKSASENVNHHWKVPGDRSVLAAAAMVTLKATFCTPPIRGYCSRFCCDSRLQHTVM